MPDRTSSTGAPQGGAPVGGNLSRHGFFVLLLTMFLTVAGFGIVLPVLPYFARELGASSLEMGLMVSLYALAQFLFAPVWGSLSDRIGRKPVLILGMTGFGLSFTAMAFVHSVALLILVRFLGGMLSASTFPAAQALVADLTPPERRGSALAMMGGSSNLGFVMGPLLGVPITSLGYGFPGLALTGGVAILLTAALATAVLPAPAPRAASGGRRPPLAEALRLAVASPEAPCYWLVLVAALAGSSVFSMLGYYLMDRMGAPESANQLAFSVMGIASAIIQFTTVGWAMGRWGETKVAGGGFLAGSAAFMLLLAAGQVWQACAAVAVWGIALALIRPPLTTLVSRRTRLGQGVALGIQASFESMGRMVGPLLAGSLFGLHPQLPYAVVAGLLLVALVWGTRTLRRLESGPAGVPGGAGPGPWNQPAVRKLGGNPVVPAHRPASRRPGPAGQGVPVEDAPAGARPAGRTPAAGRPPARNGSLVAGGQAPCGPAPAPGAPAPVRDR
ncbi:major facilitator superfamily MFS_1 [Thermaerobacter marianensis DSM 12885]|uniref:Major facilitator superfamily MFS_1 n=1 Tax=Thermaerobacter marianensis (strain ATCC 700841 / DSM 12885 / JCM 10246 / 7p75a) TaxID=644966 RepID=E6SJG4_THEM7|nr:MFS transporter [Thermaerobacter marianensis]ADU52119.1 major facilitator superfamily MFS_1 [Thermaerobacter marianensis DSM 12885]